MSVSVVIPVYNEIENLPRLYAALRPVLESLDRPFEMLFVDDGSTDGSTAELARMASRDPAVKVVTFRRNYGQTAAMSAGLHLAAGEVIVTMDADLQNDPADIPLLLAKLDEGFDLVHGWRKQRHDTFLTRRLPSLLANRLIARVTKFPVHDLGCTLKAVRRDIARDLHLFGEMHRFIPILAHWHGARCAEIVTRHHPRRFGQSKYGLSRTLRVVLDLITVKYLTQYLASPMKLFGGIGLASLGVGTTAALATVAMKLFGQVDMTGNPLLMLATTATLAGFQFVVLGMLGELGARIYYEVQRKEPYTIRELHNIDGALGRRTSAERSARAA
ncbi:MAG: glycosyltransferase family 2 protein [Pirellulales bacterium]